MKNPFYKHLSSRLVALLTVCVIGSTLVACGDETATSEPVKNEVKAEKAEVKSDDKVESEPAEQPEPAVEKPATIESVIADVAGKENYVSYHTDIAGTLAMTLELSDNWTKNMIVLSAYDKIAEISEQIRSKKLVDENTALHYIFQTDLVDAYGNTSKGNVIIVNLSAETLAKINFDNFSSKKIPDIADISFVHPSLQ